MTAGVGVGVWISSLVSYKVLSALVHEIKNNTQSCSNFALRYHSSIQTDFFSIFDLTKSSILSNSFSQPSFAASLFAGLS